MKKCNECNVLMQELNAETPEGVGYSYFKCSECGEEIVDMKQLHNVAEKYRKIKTYYAQISKWGLSLGFRFPKELTQKYHLKSNSKVKIIPEKEGLRILPA